MSIKWKNPIYNVCRICNKKIEAYELCKKCSREYYGDKTYFDIGEGPGDWMVQDGR